MSKNNKYLLLFIAILAIAYYLTQPGRFREKEVLFFHADSTAVYKISLKLNQDSVEVVRKNNVWMLEKPVPWKVSEVQSQLLNHVFLPVKTSKTVVSEDPAKQDLYGVNYKSGVEAKLYDKQNQLLDHVFIGQSANQHYNYARHNGSNEIYQLKSNLYMQITPNPSLWRSPEILVLRLPELMNVDVKYSNYAYSMTVKDDNVYYDNGKDRFPMNPENRATSKLFMALSNLTSDQFFDNQWPRLAPYFAKPAAVVTVKTIRNKVIKLTFATGPDQFVYVMRDDYHDTIFGTSFDTLDRFTISAEHFKN